MVGSIRQILQIHTAEQLREAFLQFESEIDTALKPLEQALENNIFSADMADLQAHAGYVERFRLRVTRWLYLCSGFANHAKSIDFLQAAPKGVSASDYRDAAKKSLAGPFDALEARLENVMYSIDSRVNLAKKRMNLETEIAGKRSFAA